MVTTNCLGSSLGIPLESSEHENSLVSCSVVISSANLP